MLYYYFNVYRTTSSTTLYSPYITVLVLYHSVYTAHGSDIVVRLSQYLMSGITRILCFLVLLLLQDNYTLLDVLL